MRAVCENFSVELVEFNGERDHVHLMVNFPPTVAVSRLINSLKGVSSRRLRQEFPNWSSTIGGRNACGPVPTTPDRLAERRCPWCASTSKINGGPSDGGVRNTASPPP